MRERQEKTNLRPGNIGIFVCVFCLWLMTINCSQSPGSGVERLVQGTPVTKQIVNNEVHSYRVTLEKGQFLELAIEQHDVDTIAKVLAPNGDVYGEFDTPTSSRGTEIVRIGADSPGDYRIDVYTLSESAEPGRYTIKMVDFRPLTARDQKILAAVRLHQKADALRAKPESQADSIPLYLTALLTWMELGERAEEGNTLRAIGFAYRRMENPEKAREYFGRALEIWQEIGDHRSAAFTHIIFGVMSKKENDYQTALEHDLRAQPLWLKAGDIPEYTQNLARIGSDYVRLQDRERALEHYEKALQSSRQTDSRSLRAFILGGYGDAYAAFGDKSQALYYYRQALEQWKDLKQEKPAASVEGKITNLLAE